MKNKTSEISQFAQYAKQVSMYKTNTGGYQQKVEYIKSLFEVRVLRQSSSAVLSTSHNHITP